MSLSLAPSRLPPNSPLPPADQRESAKGKQAERGGLGECDDVIERGVDPAGAKRDVHRRRDGGDRSFPYSELRACLVLHAVAHARCTVALQAQAIRRVEL